MPQGGTILERYLRVGAILKRRLGEVPCRCPCLVTGGLRAEDNTNHKPLTIGQCLTEICLMSNKTHPVVRCFNQTDQITSKSYHFETQDLQKEIKS